MKADEALSILDTLAEIAERDDDAMCACYFSREDNQYRGVHSMDAGDALIVIQHLIEDFGLSAEVIAAMEPTT